MSYKRSGIATKVAAAAAVAVGALATLGAPAAMANGTSAGPATVIVPGSANTPLGQGGSLTPFSIGLPPQAHCTKDTATNNYHISGYIVPASVNPSTLTFTSSGPTDPVVDPGGGTKDFPLVDTTGSPYIFANTAPNSGQVTQIPNFNYAFFSIDGRNSTATLPAGTYNVGIGCSTGAATNNGDVFWNVQVTFTASTSDPAGETWTAANPGTNVPESPLTILLPLSALGLLGVGVVVVRRRHDSDGAPIAV